MELSTKNVMCLTTCVRVLTLLLVKQAPLGPMLTTVMLTLNILHWHTVTLQLQQHAQFSVVCLICICSCSQSCANIILGKNKMVALGAEHCVELLFYHSMNYSGIYVRND